MQHLMLLNLMAVGGTTSREETPILRRFTVTLTESQVVVALIVLGISFLALVVIIVNLSIFSYSYQRKQPCINKPQHHYTAGPDLRPS